MKAVSNVHVIKDGFMSIVTLHAVGNPINLRVAHKDAEMIRQQIISLIV